MAIITSGDSVASATVTIIQDTDGVYAIQVTALTPAQTPFAIEFNGDRIWQGPARLDAGATS